MLALFDRISHARILVVEDEPLAQQFIVKALARAGFINIDTANDGAIALKKTRQNIPDLVVLDLKMPNMDGFAYCEEVRNSGTLPRIPIIVQTMLDDRESRLRALSYGADDYLNKPIDPDELTLRVQNQLKRYIAFQDIQEACVYLKMELQHVRHVLQQDCQPAASSSLLRILARHCEVLETMTIIPATEN